MTLRKIHQNLSQIKQHNFGKAIQNTNNLVVYDEEQQPPRPKIMIDSFGIWDNSRIKQDLSKIGQKASTARQNKRQSLNRIETGKFTALNSSRDQKYEVWQNQKNNSLWQNNELFIPERDKMKQKEKLALIKKQLKQRNGNVNSQANKSLSLKNNIQNEQVHEDHQNQFKKLKSIQPNKTIHYISHLRKYQQEQKQRETLLNNRLKFITIAHQKDDKKLKLVKKKFEKVLSIRNDAINQKQSLNKTKSLIEKEEWKNKFSKVGSIKKHHQDRRLSVSRLSQNRSLQASRLREEQKNLQRQILSNRLTDLRRKKEAVKSAQISLEKSREKIAQMSRSRISSIRTIQNKSLIKNYMKVERRDRINEQLYETLQKEIKLIDERKLKAASELKQYEELLGMSGKRSKETSLFLTQNCRASVSSPFNKIKNHPLKLQRAVSSTFSTSGSKSFYLTNF